MNCDLATNGAIQLYNEILNHCTKQQLSHFYLEYISKITHICISLTK